MNDMSGLTITARPTNVAAHPTINRLQKAPDSFIRQLHEQPHNSDMNTPSRHEVDAKLGEIEARMDVRMVAIDAKFDALQRALLQQSEDLKSFKSDVQTGLADFKKEVHLDNKATRTTIITTGIAAVLSIVLGVAAFNATVLSNMVASFESGRNTAQALSDTASKLEKAQATKDDPKPQAPAAQNK